MAEPNQKQLELLQSIFSNTDLGESVVADIYKANKGQMNESIDFLLEINQLKSSSPSSNTQETKKISENQKGNSGEKMNLPNTTSTQASPMKMENKNPNTNSIHSPVTIPTSSQNPTHDSTKVNSIPPEKNGLKPENTLKSPQKPSPNPPPSETILYQHPNESKPVVLSPSTNQNPPVNIPSNPIPPYHPTPPPYNPEIHMEEINLNIPPIYYPQPSAPPMDPPTPPPSTLAPTAPTSPSLPEEEWKPPTQSGGIMSWFPNKLKKVFQGSEEVIDGKGLTNGVGENNCFLNVVIQSLWHLKSFRTSFLKVQDHIHPPGIDENTCAFCALKVIFIQYEFSEASEIPPTALREAMSVLFKSNARFQLGELDDAAEAHDSLLNVLHKAVAGKDDDGKHSSFVQETFCMQIVEYLKCTCGGPTQPFPFSEYIHYVSASALRKSGSQHLCVTEDGSISHSVSFGQIIKEVHHSDNSRKCKMTGCNKTIDIRYALCNHPSVLSIGIVWTTDSPGVDFIYETLDMIDTELKIKDMFDSVQKDLKYILRGLVCYYGKHYKAYFKDLSINQWVAFDDTSVKKIGPNWKDVVAKCRDGHFQPFILWYELPEFSQ